MLILGIETSGPRGGIAICRNAVCLAESELENAPPRHAQTLVIQIRDMFRRLDLRFEQLDAVAVSIGPGSFTGLRVGVVCAKTLAFATGCRLAAVDTLEVIAANSPPEVASVQVVADAQRGDLFAATYHRSSEVGWLREAAPTIFRADAWLAALPEGAIVSGPGLAAYRDVAVTTWRSLPETAWTPLACLVAAIGARQIERGIFADCAALEPFYVRRSAAEEKADPAWSATVN
jgi:tRNA threonylcarbamoyladenosine biosynthesis protein TsaB